MGREKGDDLIPPGQKHSFEMLLTEKYSKYGVTSGVLTLESSTSISCGLICSEWPSSGFAAVLRGWKVELILMKKNMRVHFVQKWFHEAQVLLCQQGVKIS
jgi:hypothetical protein